MYEVVNPQGVTCGHRHKTEAAAEKCREKLLFCRIDPAGSGGPIWAARWHGAKVIEIPPKGRIGLD